MQHTSVIIDGVVYVPQHTQPTTQLEPTNHGKPQCPDIAINETKASQTKPQAWSNIVDGKECWYYNYEGAMAEARYLGKRIPTIDEWMEILETISGNPEQKAAALGTPLAGVRGASDGKFCSVGRVECLVSSSPFGSEGVHCAYLGRGNAVAYRLWVYRERGFSVRFLSGVE